LHLTSYYLQRALQRDFSSLMSAAKQRGMTTSFDPNSDPEQGRNEGVLEVIGHTDILFVNEPEAKLLSGQDDAGSACRELGRLCPIVVVKLGARGSVAYRDGELTSAGGFAIDAADTTGAGDSFAAGFVHAFLDMRTIEECLTVGNACGALSTTKPGGTGGQPDQAELNRFLSQAVAIARN
jgi:sugar/nucleoside kinase (ribokinase family)